MINREESAERNPRNEDIEEKGVNVIVTPWQGKEKPLVWRDTQS